MVRSDCCLRIVDMLQQCDACFCYRCDFHHRVESPIPDRDYEKAIQYAGSDLLAMRVGWWETYRDYMPDMLIGAEAWDPVIRTLIQETNPDSNVTLHRVICHERHGSYWENPAHRYKLGMQLYNLGLARAFFMSRGINPNNFGIP